MARLIPIALAALVLGLGGVACGGDDDGEATGTTTEETTTETTETTTTGGTSDAGKEVFVANRGPALDGIGLSEADIEAQVRNGGGGMPAFEGDLSDDEIAQVSAYVAGNS
jgi:cytochrome c551